MAFCDLAAYCRSGCFGGVKMKRLSFAVVLAIALSGTGAFGADMAVKAPRMATVADVYQWTGFYIGAAGNYHDGTVLDEGCVGLCEHNHKVRDGYLSVNAGYDYQFANRVVLGAFGWIGVTPVESDATLAPGIVVHGKTDFAGFIGGRIGYAAGDFLPYAFVGGELVHGKVTIAVAPIPTNEKTHTGYGAGVGLEYRLASNWSVDGRYMYSYLGRESYDFGGGVTTAAERAHTLSLGINYRFGGPVLARY
jgi:outer membrane immunogenic protein